MQNLPVCRMMHGLQLHMCHACVAGLWMPNHTALHTVVLSFQVFIVPHILPLFQLVASLPACRHFEYSFHGRSKSAEYWCTSAIMYSTAPILLGIDGIWRQYISWRQPYIGTILMHWQHWAVLHCIQYSHSTAVLLNSWQFFDTCGKARLTAADVGDYAVYSHHRSCLLEMYGVQEILPCCVGAQLELLPYI